MGYFSNGCEADDYRARYCAKCVNWRDKQDNRGEGCPIMDLHYLWNYDAVGEKGDAIKKKALDTLIPYKGIFNDECAMFLEK